MVNNYIMLTFMSCTEEKTLDRIFTLLNDSNLPVKVDVQSYDLITYPPLKEHIDANMLLLFTHDQFEENLL